MIERDDSVPEEFLDDEKYPTTHVEDSEARYDAEVAPLLDQAHMAAARLGIPVISFAAFDDDGGVATKVTAKNMAAVNAALMTALFIGSGDHQHAANMLAAAVRASRDGRLAEKYTDMMAKAMGLDTSDLTGPQKANAVMQALAAAHGDVQGTDGHKNLD